MYTLFQRYDVDKDGVLTALDFELQAKKLAEYGHLSGTYKI